MLNERAQHLLKALVERYIVDGQPVGSKTLSHLSGVKLSSASIRNIMADLEHMGLILSPHASAGRIPTAKGYRLFVDRLLTIQPLDAACKQLLSHELHPDSPQRLAEAASNVLSELTQFAGVVMTPQRPNIAFRQIEFLRLSERRILLIIVTQDGDVKNHLLLPERDYSTTELIEAANWLNHHYAGQALDRVAEALETELQSLQSHIGSLMSSAIHASRSGLSDEAQAMVITGEKNLLDVGELSSNLARLRQLFDMFERKTDLLALLNTSRTAQGVQLFIGEESGVHPLGECSVVTAPYTIDGQVVGTLGVIGPTRMAYERVIPLVDITARLVSSALSRRDLR